ncbi:MAG: hypothetical protein QNJ05_08195 [Woeseiaceae bacterium]|nr:hypothetical protein [Woeseiaceae bacterium]
MSRQSPHQFHSRGRTVGKWAAIAGLALVTVYLVFELGRIQAGYNFVDSASERAGFRSEINALNLEIERLNEQISILETHKAIDAAAYKEVEVSLTDLQAKIQEQRDAIAFYRGIVSPKDGAAGLRVQDLKLEAGRSEREFSVRLVLVQAMQHDRRVSGDVILAVTGEQDGAEKTYTYSDLRRQDAEEKWAFSFRYFQDFERDLVLPDGFTPLTVNIEVRSRTRSIGSIEESYAWASARG